MIGPRVGSDLFRQVLRQHLNQLLRWLPAAARCDPLAVHRARVATRRLREVLPVVAPDRRGRALERAARRVTRALGPVRELDVALATLTEFAAVSGLSKDSIARVASAIDAERRSLCAGMQRRLDRCDIRALGRRVRR